MQHNCINEKMKKFRNHYLIGLLGSSLIFTSCGDDDTPAPATGDPEVITDLSLVFTNDDDPTDVSTVSAQDPDGIGSQELQILSNNTITLTSGATYTMTFVIENGLDEDDVEDITEEIEEEAEDHQFFYSFTNDAFTSPMGDGNIDDSSHSINYTDQLDANQRPVGLATSWTAGAALASGSFRVVLMHQDEGQKTDNSGVDDGDADFDLTFNLVIE